MFTGIVEEIGKIKNIHQHTSFMRIFIYCKNVLDGTSIGDSIAVNGVCLTVNEMDKESFSADVMPETVRKTNFTSLKPGSNVNLERALRLFDRLGGHIVTGHVDGVGVISKIVHEGNADIFTIDSPEHILKYIIQKGSVALDGTSLTVASYDDRSFKVSLIPLTRGHTNLGLKKEGDFVNIECDIIGKYVEKLISPSENNKSNLTLGFLEQHGFL